MDYIVFIFSFAQSFYIVSEESEDSAWKLLSTQLSKSLERTKSEAKLIKQQPFYGVTKLKR